MDAVPRSILQSAILTLFTEAYIGPENPEAPWFSDLGSNSGLLGTLSSVSAETASKAQGAAGSTIASHTAHVRYALSLANRAYRGENPYPTADWEASWSTQAVSSQEWEELLEALRSEYEQLQVALGQDIPYEAPMVLPGTLGIIAHGAWHLGAVRTLLELV